MKKWKKITGFEDCYEISNNGELRSLERDVRHYKGGVRRCKSSIKKIRADKDGYMRCNLKKDGKRYDFRIHRLVADAFLENEKHLPIVNHKNGIKSDNRVDNLEWCSFQNNTIHAVKNRLIKTKLTDKEAMEVFNSNSTHREIAKKYGVNPSIVWRIKNKKAYKHLFK